MYRLYKRPDSPNYYFRGTVCGWKADQTTSIPLKYKAAAKKYVDNATRDAIQRSLAGPTDTTFENAAMSYKHTIGRKDQLFVERLEGYFAGMLLSKIGQRRIDEAARFLYPGRKPQTVNRQVYTPMSAIMRMAAQDGLVTWGGLRRPRSREMPRERWATPEECTAFLEHADSDLAGFFIFLLYTGARISEALGLRWDDVQLSRRHIDLREFKTRKLRPVAISSDVYDVLRGMDSREGFVFPWRRREQVYHLWNPACAAAGIVDLHPHDMRHTYATWLRQSGMDLRAIMEAGGWKDAKSVFRYSHVTSAEILEAVEGLPKVGRG